jgi:hypothetical protein
LFELEEEADDAPLPLEDDATEEELFAVFVDCIVAGL